MKIDLLEMLQMELRSLNIQMLLLSEPYENFQDFDFHFLKQNLVEFNYEKLMECLKETVEPGTIFLFHEYLCVQYIFFAFPEEVRREYGQEYCLIGPILFQPVTTSEFQKFINVYHIKPEHYRDIQEFYNQIPVFPSSDVLFAMLMPFIKSFLGEEIQIRTTNVGEAGFLPIHYEEYQHTDVSQTSLQALEARYQAETDFLNAVCEGNTEQALLLYHKYSQYRIVPRVADQVRNEKNMLLALNTALRKATQMCSIHPFHLDNLSTQVAIQIENCTRVNQLYTLARTMIRKYCMMVKNHSRKGYSLLIQISMDYIDTNYPGDVSLDSLSKFCSVTNSYLSALFKKETGTTITDYINQIRIRKALSLLNTTNISIQDIALQCGYREASYFTRIFKKYQGISPKDYRKKIQG